MQSIMWIAVFSSTHLIFRIVSYNFCDKLPHTGWLKTTETCSLTLLEPEAQNQGVGRVTSFQRLWGRTCSLVLFLTPMSVSVNIRHSLCRASGILYEHPSYTNTHHWIRNPPQSSMTSTWLHLQRRYFQQGHIYRYQKLKIQHII